VSAAESLSLEVSEPEPVLQSEADRRPLVELRLRRNCVSRVGAVPCRSGAPAEQQLVGSDSARALRPAGNVGPIGSGADLRRVRITWIVFPAEGAVAKRAVADCTGVGFAGSDLGPSRGRTDLGWRRSLVAWTKGSHYESMEDACECLLRGDSCSGSSSIPPMVTR